MANTSVVVDDAAKAAKASRVDHRRKNADREESDALETLLRRVKRIELRAKKALSSFGQGAYHSRFKGRGMSFVESRNYAAGDDPRHVDWNASARSGELFVKQFVEERELTVLLCVDISASMATGSRARKRQVAAEVAALLAFSALRNNDKVGLALFSDRIERLLRPKKGRSHVLRLVRDVLLHQPIGTTTSFETGVETALHLSKQRAVVVLVSDFIDVALGTPAGTALERKLRVLSHRHDVIAVTVTDPIEQDLPSVGLLAVRDPETGDNVVIDTDDPRVRQAFVKQSKEHQLRVQQGLMRLGIDTVEVQHDTVDTALVRYLMRRKRQVAA